LSECSCSLLEAGFAMIKAKWRSGLEAPGRPGERGAREVRCAQPVLRGQGDLHRGLASVFGAGAKVRAPCQGCAVADLYRSRRGRHCANVTPA
jgi:hypothetical protein